MVETKRKSLAELVSYSGDPTKILFLQPPRYKGEMLPSPTVEAKPIGYPIIIRIDEEQIRKYIFDKGAESFPQANAYMIGVRRDTSKSQGSQLYHYPVQYYLIDEKFVKFGVRN